MQAFATSSWGGVAVVLHGYLRATANLDLVVGMDQPNIETALLTFDRLGFHPRAPVTLQSFADADERSDGSMRRTLKSFRSGIRTSPDSRSTSSSSLPCRSRTCMTTLPAQRSEALMWQSQPSMI
jgi:hypothetical protein